jgi:hypothetical protein
MHQALKGCIGLLACLLYMGWGAVASAAPVEVTVTAKLPSGQDILAVDAVRRQAVQKMLLHLMPRDNAPQSLYQQILQDYPRYAGQAVQIIQQKEDGGDLYVVGRTAVDFDAMQARLTAVGQSVQDQHDDWVAAFFIKVEGADAQETDNGEETARRTYNETFRQMGFSVASAEAAPGIRRLQGMPYGQYVANVKAQAARDDIGLSVAVIGEIAMEDPVDDGSGVLRKAVVHIQSFDMWHGGCPIASYQESYSMKGKDKADADAFIFTKAAFNSAKALAAASRQYFQQPGH